MYESQERMLRSLLSKALTALAEHSDSSAGADRSSRLMVTEEIRAGLAQLEADSSAHTWFDAGRAPFPAGRAIDIRLGDGSVLCDCLLQFDGDIWWAGAGTGEKFIDPACTSVTHWRAHAESGATHEPEVSLDAAGADADGHAFRLLVQQRMSLAFRAADEGMVASLNGRSVEVPLGDDDYAAVRRAVALADDPRRART